MNLTLWQERVQRYARAAFTQDELTDFTDLATAEIRSDIKARELVSFAELLVSDGVIALPAEFSEEIAVIYGRNAPALDKATPAQVAGYEAAQGGGGVPQVYVMAGAQMMLYPVPGDGSPVTVAYWFKPPIVNTGENDQFSDLYPELYLQGALIYAYDYQRDYSQGATARTLYQGMVDTINQIGQDALAGGALYRRL